MSQEYISASNISTQTPPEGVRIVDIPISLQPESNNALETPELSHTYETVQIPEVDIQLLDEVEERVPKEIRLEFIQEDETIRTQLTDAREVIEKAKTETTKNVVELREESEVAITRTQETFERFKKKKAKERDASKAEATVQYEAAIAEITLQYNAFNAAVDEQYGLSIEKKGMRAEGYITEQSRVIDAVDAFIAEAELIAGKIERGVDVTVELQTAHEARRDTAVDAIDKNSERRTKLLNDIQNATRSLIEKVQARIEVERQRKLLHSKESKLLTDEDDERKRVMAPYEEYFIHKLGMEKDSDRLKTALEQYEVNNDFPDLKNIIDTLETYPAKFLENKSQFDELTDEIAELNFKLKAYRIEYDELPDKFAASRTIIKTEVSDVSPIQLEYGANAHAWAEAFAKLTTGDLNTTNNVPIPSQLVNLRQLKLDVYSSVRVVDKDDPLDGVEEPVLSPHIEAFLRLAPENREELIEGVVRAKLREGASMKIEAAKHATGADLRESVIDAGIEIGGLAIHGVKNFGRRFKYVRSVEIKE